MRTILFLVFIATVFQSCKKESDSRIFYRTHADNMRIYTNKAKSKTLRFKRFVGCFGSGSKTQTVPANKVWIMVDWAFLTAEDAQMVINNNVINLTNSTTQFMLFRTGLPAGTTLSVRWPGKPGTVGFKEYEYVDKVVPIDSSTVTAVPDVQH